MLTSIIYLWITFITAVAAWTDIKTRIIPNGLILVGFVGLLSLQFLNHNFTWQSLLIGSFVSLSLWHFKFIGGGDSKLLMLVSLAFSPPDLLWLYVNITAMGGLQALGWRLLKKPSALPYAVAIAGGTMVTIFLNA